MTTPKKNETCHRKRLSMLRERLSRAGVEGFLITDLTNLRYITGFTGSSGFSIITQKDAIFVTDFRYQEQAQQEVKGFTLEAERKDRAEEVKRLMDAYGIKRLAFEDHSVSYGLYRKLLRRGIRLRPLSSTIESLRARKSRKELSLIKEAIGRAERAFRKLLPSIKAGVSEQRLASKLESFLREEGCKNIPFGVIVASGSMSALPHARPTSRRLRKGDLVIFDWGGECEGYYSDMTRTVILKGRDTERQKKLYSIVLEAQERAIRAVMAGVRASAIDAAARTYIKQSGYDEHFGHGTGHGVGLAVHERPFVSWRSKDIIERDMVFTVEPGLYLPGFGGVRIEDMVVVRDGKAEVLTTLPKALQVI